MKILIVWAMLAQGGDIATTSVGLHRGCHEVSAFAKHPYVGMGLKGAGMLMLPFAMTRLEKHHPKWAKGITIGIAVSGTFATGWNLTQLPKC